MTRSSTFYHQCNQVTEPMREALTRLDALLDRMEVSSDPATSLVAARSLTVTQAMADTIFDERATIAHRPATPQGPTDLVYRSLPVYIDDELMDADAHWSIDMRDIVLSHSAGDETTVTVMEHPLTDAQIAHLQAALFDERNHVPSKPFLEPIVRMALAILNHALCDHCGRPLTPDGFCPDPMAVPVRGWPASLDGVAGGVDVPSVQ